MVDRLTGQINLTALAHIYPFTSRFTNSSQTPWITSVSTEHIHYKVVRQNDTDMTSHFMQFEKVGRGLLQKAYRGEGECYISLKRVGQIRKDQSWKTQVNIGTLEVNKQSNFVRDKLFSNQK